MHGHVYASAPAGEYTFMEAPNARETAPPRRQGGVEEGVIS